jgi:4-hydroxy-tetrahydrodipicolinate synthase
VASVKIPGVPADPARARARVARLREILPQHVTVGVSGDAFGAAGLNAGCDAWYSVAAGTLPRPILAITRLAQAGQADRAREESERLQPLWDLFARHGSLRVIAAAAAELGLTQHPNLPLPLRGLQGHDRKQVADVLGQLQLDG